MRYAFSIPLLLLGVLLWAAALFGMAATAAPAAIPGSGFETYCPDGSPEPECLDNDGNYSLTGFVQTEDDVIFVYTPMPFQGTAPVIAAIENWDIATDSPTTTHWQLSATMPLSHACGGELGAPLPLAYDGINSIIWAPLVGSGIGRACWNFGTNECDIILDSTWPGFADPGAERTVAAHEVGHCLGLSHSEVGAAVMYATYSEPKQLHPDDIAGFCAIYTCGVPTPTSTATATATASPTATPTPELKGCAKRQWPVKPHCKFIPGIARDGTW